MQSSIVRKAVMLLVLVAAGVYFALVREPEPSSGLEWIELGAAPVEAEESSSSVEFSGDSVPQARVEPLPAEVPVRTARIRGQVFALGEVQLAGLVIERRHAYLDATRSAVAADGSFEMEVGEIHGELWPADPAWISLGGERHLLEDLSDGYSLIVAPAVVWRGTVLDDHGQPIGDAVVHVSAPGDALVPFGIASPPIDHPSQRGWSDERGRFAIGPAPRVQGARIEASRTGYQPKEIELPIDPALPVTIVLTSIE
ncbi:MAG: carboxypeptidase regulatory-like domain-containing protein [Planctomycetes bacterium]|nr:carboxypeptidase regulatory-like domain-containing protein [Planctomycetota bacterium]